jgi:hypothetical protein
MLKEAKSKVSNLSGKTENTKSLWENIQEAPWYAPILYSLTGLSVVALSLFLKYLNRKRELQIIHRKNIMEFKVRMADRKLPVDSNSQELNDV